MRHIKALIKTSVCVTSLCMAGPAFATVSSHDWYAGLNGDLTWLRHSDTGGGGNVDLGYAFSDIRLEGDVGYNGASGKNGYSGTHYLAYMGNIYYDFTKVFPSSSGLQVVPYIGAGAGDAQIHFGNSGVATTLHHHESTFAYQGMAGLGFISPSMPNTDWFVGYRYLGTDENNLHANNLEAGVRFHF